MFARGQQDCPVFEFELCTKFAEHEGHREGMDEEHAPDLGAEHRGADRIPMWSKSDAGSELSSRRALFLTPSIST